VVFFSDCYTTVPNLTVISQSADYLSTGEFSCQNGRYLFHENGTLTLSNQTTCLASAQWSGEDGLVCLEGTGKKSKRRMLM